MGAVIPAMRIAEFILEFVSGVSAAWNSAAPLVDNAVTAVGTILKLDPNIAGGVIGKELEKIPIEYANLETGQVAQVASYGASFAGVPDTVDVYCVRRSAGTLVIAKD